MKKSEIAAIIAIASLSVAIAYFVANAVIGKPSSASVKVRTVAPISAEVDQPDGKIFNKDAINPTVEVVIGNE
jgi:hypothetical protein